MAELKSSQTSQYKCESIKDKPFSWEYVAQKLHTRSFSARKQSSHVCSAHATFYIRRFWDNMVEKAAGEIDYVWVSV